MLVLLSSKVFSLVFVLDRFLVLLSSFAKFRFGRRSRWSWQGGARRRRGRDSENLGRTKHGSLDWRVEPLKLRSERGGDLKVVLFIQISIPIAQIRDRLTSILLNSACVDSGPFSSLSMLEVVNGGG